MFDNGSQNDVPTTFLMSHIQRGYQDIAVSNKLFDLIDCDPIFIVDNLHKCCETVEI